MIRINRDDLVRHFRLLLSDWYESDHYRNGDASALVEDLEARGWMVHQDDEQ